MFYFFISGRRFSRLHPKRCSVLALSNGCSLKIKSAAFKVFPAVFTEYFTTESRELLALHLLYNGLSIITMVWRRTVTEVNVQLGVSITKSINLFQFWKCKKDDVEDNNWGIDVVVKIGNCCLFFNPNLFNFIGSEKSINRLYYT